MCYFTAIGIKPKFESKLDDLKSSYKVEPCENSSITSYSTSFKWFWIYDKNGLCSCDLFVNREEIISSFNKIVSDSFSFNLISHFYKADPDEESFQFTERRVEQIVLNNSFEIPDDIMLKVVK